MKNFIISAFCLFSAVFCQAQYHITYKITYQSNSESVEFETINGYDAQWQEYYIMDGNYKSVFDGGDEWMQIYNGSNNKFHTVACDGTIQSRDASINNGARLIRIEEVGLTEEILGFECKSLKLVYDNFQTTYYYSSEVNIDHKSFSEQKLGNWGEIIEYTQGGLPLKFITRYQDYSMIGVAHSVKKVELTPNSFKPKQVVKNEQSRNKLLLTNLARRLNENYKDAKIDFNEINSTTIKGQIQVGQVKSPLDYIAIKPRYQLTKTKFGNAEYIEVINEEYNWRYDPMSHKVFKGYDDFEDEHFDLFTEYKQIAFFDYDKYNIVDIRQLSDSISTFNRIIVADGDDKIVFEISTSDYYISQIEKNKIAQKFYEYKKFKGIPVPTRIVDYTSDNEMILTTETIEFNLEYDLNMFNIPDSLLSLVEETEIKENDEDYYSKAEKLMNEGGDIPLAIENYNKAIELDPYKKIYHNQLGLAKLKNGDVYDAIVSFSKAIDLDSLYFTAQYNLGYAKMSLGDYKASIKDFDKAIKLNDVNPLYYTFRGLSYYKLQKFDSALSNFEKVILLDKEDRTGYWNIAMAAYHLKDYDRAKINFSKSIDIGYVSHELYNYRGICNYKLEEYELAIEDFEKAIEAPQPLKNYFGNLGNSYSKINESKKAIEAYQNAINMDSTYAEGHNSIGLEYLKDESYDRAIHAFSSAIKQNPNEAMYFDNRAYARNQKMDYLGAIEDYSQSINLYPSDPNIYYMRGMAKIHVNDNFDACKDFQKAEEMGSDLAKEAISEYCHTSN